MDVKERMAPVKFQNEFITFEKNEKYYCFDEWPMVTTSVGFIFTGVASMQLVFLKMILSIFMC